MLFDYCTNCRRTSCYGCSTHIWKEIWITTPTKFTIYGPNGVVYDSDRYELVEKKDWKIKQLKETLERKKRDLENTEKESKSLFTVIATLIKDIEETERQIEELEK